MWILSCVSVIPTKYTSIFPCFNFNWILIIFETVLRPPQPARKTQHGQILLNSLYCRNTSMLLRGPREPREDCLYTPQHRVGLCVLLGLVGLSTLHLHAPTQEGLVSAGTVRLFMATVCWKPAPSFRHQLPTSRNYNVYIYLYIWTEFPLPYCVFF